MINFQQLKEKYPNPRPAGEVDYPNRSRNYCVGGALCLELGYSTWSFPQGEMLQEKLREANPNLPHPESILFANEITRENDKGEFEKAWQLLYQALNFKRREEQNQEEEPQEELELEI